MGSYITKGISSGSNEVDDLAGESEGQVYKIQNPSVRNTGSIYQQTTDVKKITRESHSNTMSAP